ncbi:hypothetical protein ACHAXR_000025, partial [Thalassiosira sp. AJA248-18]
ESPISKKSIKQVGILYVDDTNLWAGLDERDDLATVAMAGQEAVDQWGESLQAVGGALNPDKCSWTVAEMTPKGNGEWEYRDQRASTGEDDESEADGMDELDEITLRVPQSSGPPEKIKHLRSNEAVENLGLYARPDGCNDAHLGQMRTRVEDWTKLVKNGALPT